MSRIEITTYVSLTSKDAEELAKKLRKKEQGAKLGEDMTVDQWYIGDAGCIVFLVDQARAEEQGLMGPPICRVDGCECLAMEPGGECLLHEDGGGLPDGG